VAAELTARAQSAIADLPVDADVVQVGSTARGTWVSGDRDIDLFVRFSADLGRESLEKYGLAVGHAVLPDGHEEYAEHPYVKGAYDGFDVDLVPCHDVDRASDLVSAVDRTPFHDAYLSARLDGELAADVVLAKAFLKGIGAYGSDLRTEGFSGYLTELLVAEFGGFVPLVESARSWHPPVEFDPEAHAAQTFDDPLVVVDPTDPTRNVAAVLSAANLARFQHYARDLLDAPRVELFEPETPAPLDAAGVRDHLARRETTPVAVVFPAPNLVDDQLWPQLRRSLDGIVRGLDDRGFGVLRARAMVEDATPTPSDVTPTATDAPSTDAPSTHATTATTTTTRAAALYAELEAATRPAVERHEGPPGDNTPSASTRRTPTTSTQRRTDRSSTATGTSSNDSASSPRSADSSRATPPVTWHSAPRWSRRLPTATSSSASRSQRSQTASDRRSGPSTSPTRESSRGRLCSPRQAAESHVDADEHCDDDGTEHGKQERDLGKRQPQRDVKREREGGERGDHDPPRRILCGGDEQPLKQREIGEVDAADLAWDGVVRGGVGVGHRRSRSVDGDVCARVGIGVGVSHDRRYTLVGPVLVAPPVVTTLRGRAATRRRHQRPRAARSRRQTAWRCPPRRRRRF